MYSLKEVSEFTGLTISQIDKYENEGIVALPLNKGTHYPTLYDEEGVKNLLICKIYNELGYNKPKLKEIMKSSNEENKNVLSDAILSLETKIKELQRIVTIAKYIDDNELDLSIIFDMFNLFSQDVDADYSMMMPMTAYVISKFGNRNEEIEIDEDTEQTYDVLISLFDEFVSELNFENKVTSDETQTAVMEFYKKFAKEYYGSVIIFQSIVMFSLNYKEFIDELDYEYGKGSSGYIKGALMFFCKKYKSKRDMEMQNALNTILDFFENSIKAESIEVQTEINKIFLFYKNVPHISLVDLKEIMVSYLDYFKSIETLDSISSEEIKQSLFLAKAFEYFINETFK